MDKNSSSENNKKVFFDKYKFLLFFLTWITKISTLVLLFPKSLGNHGDLGNMGYYQLVFLFLIIIIPLELVSFGLINYTCGKILKIILISFDLLIYYFGLLSNAHSFYFPYILYIISFSLYFIFCLILLYFIFDEFTKSRMKEEQNEAKEMLTIDKNS